MHFENLEFTYAVHSYCVYKNFDNVNQATDNSKIFWINWIVYDNIHNSMFQHSAWETGGAKLRISSVRLTLNIVRAP
jgi:hypothetical protein